MKAQGVSKYLSAVNAFFNIMDTRSGRKTRKRKIFVATDDQSVIQEVKEDTFQNWYANKFGTSEPCVAALSCA